MCHCEEGYKGGECEIPAGECQVPGCSGHGRCIEGECHCERGFKGHDCSECKFHSSSTFSHPLLICLQVMLKIHIIPKSTCVCYSNFHYLQPIVWIQHALAMVHASMDNATVSFPINYLI